MKPAQMRAHAAEVRHIADQKILECLRQSERRHDGRDYEPILERLYEWRKECAKLATYR